jgi:hypothetical protein
MREIEAAAPVASPWTKDKKLVRSDRRAWQRVTANRQDRHRRALAVVENGAQRLRRWVREDRQRLMDEVRAAGLADGKPRSYKQWHCLLERHRRTVAAAGSPLVR